MEVAHLILKNHGEKCSTYETAAAFLAQRLEIVKSAPTDDNGDIADEYSLDAELVECENDFLKSLLEDYAIILERECDWLLSDDCVDENILANGYMFTADGKFHS